MACILAASFLALEAKDIGILADRSMSVEQENRTEAVRLIGGLLNGSIPPEMTARWHFLPEAADVSDPDLRAHHDAEAAQITRLLETGQGDGLAAGSHNLFLGDFGDLATALALANVTWKKVERTSEQDLAEWGSSIRSSDKETHFELARAITANRLPDKESFYLFVVSDGIGDLVNWPVSNYLDAAKTTDLRSLERDDFRDSAKAAVLEQLNLKRRSGEDVRIGSRTSPGYAAGERNQIERFRRDFSEKYLGRISLRAPHLRDFFQTHPGKVPVSVLIYSAEPRRSASIRFTQPSGTTPETPFPITPDTDRIEWEESWISGQPSPGSAITLSAHLAATGEEIATKAVGKESVRLLRTFPDLPEGDLELRLELRADGLPPSRASAFIQWRRSSPELRFTGAWTGRDTVAAAWRFDPQRDRDILATKVGWEWSSDQGGIGAPRRLTRLLSQFDPDTIELGPQLESSATLSPSRTSAPLSDIFASASEAAEPLPLQGLYRLRLSGEWEDGARAETEAWFQLPKPRLVVLGYTEDVDAGSPRRVKPGDSIKIGNWMHNWKNFDYDLIVERQENNFWTEIPRASAPLKLERAGGEALIRVEDAPSENVRFTVTFGPKSSRDRELVELIAAEGFIKGRGNSILPWILGGCVLATIGLFAWNFLSRR